MTLLRAADGFPDVFGIAARDLADPAAFLEKDYWVTQVIRALNETAPGGFVLKGGTSLSKGYGIINRFSEDVDILLVRQAGESTARAERRLTDLTDAVAGSLGLSWEPARLPGRGRHASRGDLIRYPGSPISGLDLVITSGTVLLETRIAEGDTPSEMCEIMTLIGEWAGLGSGEFEDLAPFRIRVLEPRRTLIEKLVAVHHAMSTWTPDRPPNQQRFGRHYYDVYKLLAHPDTLDKLADRVRFGHLLAEIEMISDEFYGGHTERPDEGFAHSIAFTPPHDTELRRWAGESYRISMGLLSPAEAKPDFTQVLRRVAEKNDLL